jgi:hypothetical protein
MGCTHCADLVGASACGFGPILGFRECVRIALWLISVFSGVVVAQLSANNKPLQATRSAGSLPPITAAGGARWQVQLHTHAHIP